MKNLKRNAESLRILILDALWKERPEEDTPTILGGLQLHHRVLEYLNRHALTIGLTSYPPTFRHRFTYAVKQDFNKPLRLEFYRHLVKLTAAFLRIIHVHKPHIVYNPGVGWHNDWLALIAKLLGLKVASYFHHYSLPGGDVVYPRNLLDFPSFKEICKCIGKTSRIPFFKLLDHLVSFQQLKLADVVFTGTGFGLDQLTKIGRKKPVILTGVGIDLEEFREAPPRSSSSLWDGLFVGRMVPEKGVYDLLTIWKGVVDKIPTAKLAVVGKRIQPYFDVWVRRLREMKLEENVFHLGELVRENLIKTYYSSKVFIFPSRIEGAGIVIAEAMAAGLPVVARNLPAYRTLYSDAPALYMLDDEEVFSTKVISLLTFEEERHRMGLANREYAIRKFSWENVSRKILSNLIKSALKN